MDETAKYYARKQREEALLPKEDKEVSKPALSAVLNAIADLIERAQDDTCRSQRRLDMGREGAAKCEALNAKQCLILAIDKFKEIGI